MPLYIWTQELGTEHGLGLLLFERENKPGLGDCFSIPTGSNERHDGASQLLIRASVATASEISTWQKAIHQKPARPAWQLKGLGNEADGSCFGQLKNRSAMTSCYMMASQSGLYTRSASFITAPVLLWLIRKQV